jgi:dsDNA-binding SOS-regulon protein
VDTSDTATVDSGPAVADSAPVESTPIDSAPIDSAPVESDAAEPADDPPYPWDGELSSLKESDWFTGLDDRVRTSVLSGLENKHRNWARGWTRSFQENADARKDLDRRAAAVRQSEIRVQKWLHGEVDPLDEKQREIDELKQAHEAAVRAIREEHDLRLSKASGRTNEELEAARKELLTHKEKLATFAQADEARAKAQRDAYDKELDTKAGQFQQWLQSNEPEIYTNDNAFEALCTMMASGFSLKDSLTFVHGKYPKPQAPEKPEPEAVPESVALMNMGSGSGTVSGESRSFDEIMDAMRRSAMQTSGGIIGH